MKGSGTPATGRGVRIPVGRQALEGNLVVPAGASGLVVFVHGSGSSRFSPRNLLVAGKLQEAGLSTLLFDLLTGEEEARDELTAELRFDIPMLSQRLLVVTDWLKNSADAQHLNIGYFGASTGAAAALMAAAERPAYVGAVVSRGGRPDLAAAALEKVRAPTLLIVGGHDYEVIELNRQALSQLTAEKELAIVSRATHLFEEPGALQQVARLATDWFLRHLASPRAQADNDPDGTVAAGKPVKTDEDWKRVLTPLQYEVTHLKATEPPFTGVYNNFHRKGVFRCIRCGQPLFSSEAKYNSGTGWPSFWAPISEDSLSTAPDTSHGLERTEVQCRRCGAHVGHVFDDGPPPTGLRYCVNSVALKFTRNRRL